MSDKITFPKKDFHDMCMTECSRSAVLVYLAMRSHTPQVAGAAPVHYEDIAEVTRLSTRSVASAVAELIEKSILGLRPFESMEDSDEQGEAE